jgi:hypothetical protein
LRGSRRWQSAKIDVLVSRLTHPCASDATPSFSSIWRGDQDMAFHRETVETSTLYVSLRARQCYELIDIEIA